MLKNLPSDIIDKIYYFKFFSEFKNVLKQIEEIQYSVNVGCYGLYIICSHAKIGNKNVIYLLNTNNHLEITKYISNINNQPNIKTLSRFRIQDTILKTPTYTRRSQRFNI